MSSSVNSTNQARILRFALVGCGRMGVLHAERLARDGRGRIVSLFDVDAAAARSLQSRFAPSARIADRVIDTFEAGDVDAGIVCTPTQYHFEHASAFLSKGIPVLCEKPLARLRTEIVGLIAEARQRGTLLAVAYQRRLLAAYRQFHDMVLAGECGRVRAVLSHNIENWQQTIAGTWRDDPDANFGGFIGDAGSHKIDAAFFVTGLEPVEVFARCDRWGSRVETTASVSALLSGDVPLTMDFIGHAQHFSETLSIHGEKADLVLSDGEMWMAGGGNRRRIAANEGDSNPVSAFLDSLIGGAENFAPPECALPVFDLTRAILESSRTGRSVPIGKSLP